MTWKEVKQKIEEGGVLFEEIEKLQDAFQAADELLQYLEKNGTDVTSELCTKTAAWHNTRKLVT